MVYGNPRSDGLWPNQPSNDARNVIRAKTRKSLNQPGGVTDARQLLKGKHQPKTNTKLIDARQKLEKTRPAPTITKHTITPNRKEKSPISINKNEGLVPKITIFNDDLPEKFPSPPPMKSELSQLLRKNSAMQAASKKNASGRNIQSGLRIAVHNEFAQKKEKPPTKAKPKSPPRSPPLKKIDELAKHEQMKITMVNKDAAKRQEEILLQQQRKKRAKAAKRPIATYIEEESDEDSEEEELFTSPIPVKAMKYERPMMSTRSKSFAKTMAAAKAQVLSMDTMPQSSKQKVMPAPEYTNSPIEGTRLMVTNLHPIVSEDDILELFSVIGAVRRARLIKPGVAEVVYINQEHAVTAFNKYNDRDLDGQPMEIQLSISESSLQSQPHYSWMGAVTSSRKLGQKDTTEIDSAVLQQALFKGGSTGTSIRPVVFTVKI